MAAIHVHGFARRFGTSEPLFVLCVDGNSAWLRDDEGYKETAKLADLEPVSYSDGAAYLIECDRVKARADAAELVRA